ncbi:endothelial zinc finger protein induced by tumor necrosis factor alpha [Fopius arisanus]|uniref:Endothelial zinc finger protein induced by tumor necrosis factor alpha n=1 Tax=Fopius arisanus TaxID=64838 RepID=A0A9R1TS88_9HYME|nr:PREDICTED: endothelial zinc finger protein induced by tumor necrosis factor alpha [Fopius arisanus]
MEQFHDINNACRACLSVGKANEPIFRGENEGIKEGAIEYWRILKIHGGIEVSETDGFPQRICSKCLLKLHVAHSLWEQCQKADQKLREYLSSSLNKKVHAESPLCTDKQPKSFTAEAPENSSIKLGNIPPSAEPSAKKSPHVSKKPQYVSPSPVSEPLEPLQPSPRKQHKCSDCSKIFPTELKLQRHQRTHEEKNVPKKSDFKRFLCHICSKTFRQKTGLTFHMRTHTGDKPYVCNFCNRGFASRSNCINHERTHTGVRPFVCHFCSAAFAKSCTLKAHITTHTGEANYHCKTCGKSFKRLKYLKEHRFTHTGEKPYVCKTCGTGYSHSGSLFVHEKKCKIQVRNYHCEGEGPW